ncbi:MAG TPA: hypothetical protein VFM65_00695 [Flavobacteriaceae bacterium]|nr:hypothetical protein [Flavobacteriaceae bacterium]
MRFSNSKSIKILPYICFFLLMLILVCLFLKLVWLMSSVWFYILAGLAFLGLIYLYLKAKYFQYDSFGEKLRFENKKAIRRFFAGRKIYKLEFNKRKLKQYTLKNYGIYKSLEISFSSKKNKLKKKIFDITYLSSKKTKLLRQSLDKTLNSNTQAFN